MAAETTKKLQVDSQSVSIELNVSNIRERLADPDHYKGPDKFDALINFHDIFVRLGMRGEGVPEGERWSSVNLPPKGIRILKLESNDLVSTAIDKISQISQSDFYDDPYICDKYHEANKIVLRSAAAAAGIDWENAKFLGLVRAGAVAGMMLNIPVEEQVLIQTKRLALRGDKPGDIAIGISYFDPNQMQELDGKEWVIADPAGATYGSIIANVGYLLEQGIKPKKITILNTVASHKGSELALKLIQEAGIAVQIIAGGYSPRMNESYYLETADGKPSVRDAGDGLNSSLPAELQL